MPSYAYPFEEFQRHFADYKVVRDYEHVSKGNEHVEIGPERNEVTTMLRVLDYMLQFYPEDEAKDKTAMFVLINGYIAEHAEDFNVGTMAVLGSEETGGLISQPLLRAIHHKFTSQPLSKLGKGPSPQEVIALAKKYESEES